MTSGACGTIHFSGDAPQNASKLSGRAANPICLRYILSSFVSPPVSDCIVFHAKSAMHAAITVSIAASAGAAPSGSGAPNAFARADIIASSSSISALYVRYSANG